MPLFVGEKQTTPEVRGCCVKLSQLAVADRREALRLVSHPDREACIRLVPDRVAEAEGRLVGHRRRSAFRVVRGTRGEVSCLLPMWNVRSGFTDIVNLNDTS